MGEATASPHADIGYHAAAALAHAVNLAYGHIAVKLAAYAAQDTAGKQGALPAYADYHYALPGGGGGKPGMLYACCHVTFPPSLWRPWGRRICRDRSRCKGICPRVRGRLQK